MCGGVYIYIHLTSEVGDKVVGTGLFRGGVDIFLRELSLLKAVRNVVVDAKYMCPATHGGYEAKTATAAKARTA